MSPMTDSPTDLGDEGMTTLDAAMATSAPTTAAVPLSPPADAAPSTDPDLVGAFDPERLLLGDHGGVFVIAGLLLLAIVLLTVAFGALPR